MTQECHNVISTKILW